VACAVVALVAVAPVTACGSKATPTPPAAVTPVGRCITMDEQRAGGVSLTQPDGHVVQGVIYGTATTAIIFANQVDWQLCGWQPYPKNFAQKGYMTATFNYSGAARYDDDVLAMVAEVRRRGATTVFLVGASKGGTAVLSAGARAKPPVNAVVSLSGPSFYGGVNAHDVMAGYPVPVLFVAGEYDGTFALDAQNLYDACSQTDKKLVLHKTTSHGVALLDPDTVQLVTDFLSAHTG
jgi:hypothetical protein